MVSDIVWLVLYTYVMLRKMAAVFWSSIGLVFPQSSSMTKSFSFTWPSQPSRKALMICDDNILGPPSIIVARAYLGFFFLIWVLDQADSLPFTGLRILVLIWVIIPF